MFINLKVFVLRYEGIQRDKNMVIFFQVFIASGYDRPMHIKNMLWKSSNEAHTMYVWGNDLCEENEEILR